MTLPQPATAMDERLGDNIQFLGFDGDVQQVRPGVPFALVLYWRALARMDTPYTVFVHLVDENGRIWAQADGEPAGGDIPTTAWLPGEVIADAYQLEPPPSLPAGEYTLIAGVYDKPTGARLAVRSVASGHSEDALLLGRVIVAAP
jgi:hypothetical protein